MGKNFQNNHNCKMKLWVFLKNDRFGFTSLEILLFTSLLSALVLAVFFMADPLDIMKQARDRRRLADLNSLYTVLENYGMKNGFYPKGEICESSIGSCAGVCPCLPQQHNWSPQGALWKELIKSGYMAGLPADPINNKSYHYRYQSRCGLERCGNDQCCGYYLGANFEMDSADFVWVYTP